MAPRLAVAVVAMLALATALHAAPLNDLSAFGYDPVAHTAAVVVAGNARFSILTDAVIRMEYSPNGTFEDRATIMAVNRKMARVPSFSNSTANGWLTIATSQVTVKYRLGQSFASNSLSVNTAAGASWSFGDLDSGNLLGTIRSLDELCTISLNCSQNANTYVHSESLHCQWGVVSRSGWTTIDDSDNYIMSAQQGQWFATQLRNQDEVDMYFFGHGNNFRQALFDYSKLAGASPLQHRQLLGSWYTRWYDFDNSDIERLVELFRSNTVPLDTLVLDMNWHTKNDWTGYSWDRQLFPVPNDTIAFGHYNNLRIACNLHDANGVGYWEEAYAQMCNVMGMNPAAQAPVPFSPLNESYMHALDDIVLAATGFDFWWIDWQQGGEVGGCPGGKLNPTIITNHVRGTNNLRRGKNERDAILARFGGAGSQRYPVGFSGDVTMLTWECFAYQPYFSATAANVGFMWSHDLVGPANDHELHVRWMQFGAYSSVMRIHDRGMSAGGCYPNCPNVNVWKLPYKYFAAIRDAMTQRVALLPYMYNATRVAFETGVQMVHPMYYDWPEENSAYLMGPDGQHAQYMFGDSILVAPVCVPGNSEGIAQKTVWLPPGMWYDNVFGALVPGGKSYSRTYDLSEIPIFIRAGAIVPRIPDAARIGVAAEQFTALDIYIYPGSSNGSYTLYEDDGNTHDYLAGHFSLQTFSYSVGSAMSMTIKVSAMNGTFASMLGSRRLRFVLEGHMPVQGATVNGHALILSRFAAPSSIYYDGKTATAFLDIGQVSTATPTSVSVTFAAPQNPSALSHAKGFAARTQLAKRTLDNFRETPYEVTVGPGKMKQAGSHAVKLSYLAFHDVSAFTSSIGTSYRALVQSALDEISSSPVPPPPTPTQVALVQMWNRERSDMLLCGTLECMEVNGNYEILWTEGYQPLASGDSRVKLNDFYSSANSDNWADVVPQPPANGYQAAIFSNGYVSSSAGNGLECLQVWFNPSTNDHMTLASPGQQWAADHGYNKVKDCIAYVYVEPPVASTTDVARTQQKLRDQATSTAQALLQSVLSS